MKTYTVNRPFLRGNNQPVNGPTVVLSDAEARPFRIAGHITLAQQAETVTAQPAQQQKPQRDKSKKGA